MKEIEKTNLKRYDWSPYVRGGGGDTASSILQQLPQRCHGLYISATVTGEDETIHGRLEVSSTIKRRMYKLSAPSTACRLSLFITVVIPRVGLSRITHHVCSVSVILLFQRTNSSCALSLFVTSIPEEELIM